MIPTDKGTMVKEILQMWKCIPHEELFLNDDEIWIMKAKDKSRLSAANMKFMRQTAKCTQKIILAVVAKIVQWKNKQIHHVNRLHTFAEIKYSPTETRSHLSFEKLRLEHETNGLCPMMTSDNSTDTGARKH